MTSFRVDSTEFPREEEHTDMRRNTSRSKLARQPESDEDSTAAPLVRRNNTSPRPSSPPPGPCRAPSRPHETIPASRTLFLDMSSSPMSSTSSMDSRFESERFSYTARTPETRRQPDTFSDRPPPSLETQERSHLEHEEESLALARLLMAQEAMESYALSADYLMHNSAEFSAEDYEALQAALVEEEGDETDDDEPDLSYDMMLRLGETIGDVKQERWALIAEQQIEKLEQFKFDSKEIEGKDDHDSLKCLVCQFPYETDDTLRRMPCGHCFHRDCVDQWLATRGVCPHCRQAIAPEEEASFET